MEIGIPKWIGNLVRSIVAIGAMIVLVHLALPVSGFSVWLDRDQRISVDLSGELLTLNGKTKTLKDLQGKVLFLNFWATWCGPCLAEMPSMAVLHDELEDEGLEIVAITNEDPETIKYFLERNPMPFEILIDEDDRLARRLRILSIPMTLILDKRGKLVYFHQGARLWDSPDVIENLETVLNE